MRSMLALCGILLAIPVAAQEAGVVAELRSQSDRYLRAMREGNRETLEHLLHKDYLLRSSPDFPNGATRKQFIAEFSDPQNKFSSLNQHQVSFRVFGQTAIEIGSISGNRGSNIWGKLPYSRVWVKDGNEWKVVHEHVQ